MSKKTILSVVAFTITLSPTAALANDTLGGILGGIIAGAIVSESAKQQKKSSSYKSSSTISAAQRAENKQVQESLNYFGFPAGTPDGSLGPTSRQAISGYQAYMSYPITGRLTDFEKQNLLSGYQRALYEPAQTSQRLVELEDGNKQLLKVYAGLVEDPLESKKGVEIVAAIPTFGVTEESSMRDHCDKISLSVNAKGGYMTLSNFTSGDEALNEQFCVARVSAIVQAEQLISQFQGASPEEMMKQCETMVPAFKEQITALSFSNMEEVIENTSNIILTTGQSPSQMNTTGRVCLGLAYRYENSDVALASTLMLTALGNVPYSELVGHHLHQGFGASQRADLASQWFASAVDAVQTGQQAIFAPEQPERMALIGSASQGLTGQASVAPAETSNAAFQIPTFKAQ